MAKLFPGFTAQGSQRAGSASMDWRVRHARGISPARMRPTKGREHKCTVEHVNMLTIWSNLREAETEIAGGKIERNDALVACQFPQSGMGVVSKTSYKLLK